MLAVVLLPFCKLTSHIRIYQLSKYKEAVRQTIPFAMESVQYIMHVVAGKQYEVEIFFFRLKMIL